MTNEKVDRIAEIFKHQKKDLHKSILTKIYIQTQLEDFSFDIPMEITFPTGEIAETNYEDVYKWVKAYGDSPTTCKNKNEYDKKLLAIRI